MACTALIGIEDRYFVPSPVGDDGGSIAAVSAIDDDNSEPLAEGAPSVDETDLEAGDSSEAAERVPDRQAEEAPSEAGDESEPDAPSDSSRDASDAADGSLVLPPHPTFVTFHYTWTFETQPQRNFWNFYGCNWGTCAQDPREANGDLADFDTTNLGRNGSQYEAYVNFWDSQWFASDSTPVFSPWLSGTDQGSVDVEFWTQTSSSNPSFVMNVWDDTSATVIKQVAIPSSDSYSFHHYNVRIDSAVSAKHDIRIEFGFQGTGNLEWLRVDDVTVETDVWPSVDGMAPARD